jgi:dTDP-4-amino-4,6-dideoxygalactose transaminase
MIPLTRPSIDDDDLQAVREVMASGRLVQGPRVEEFEQAISNYVGSEHAVAVSNCTTALHLSLLALGVGPGDIVVVTAYSFMATANVIELCGARPEFIDILPDTFNIDPVQLEATLTRLMGDRSTRGRVKAIIPVHTFGQLADMPSIMELADRYGLPIIEDAACALGATLQERQAGTWGLLGCFSFHPRKAITTGEGGMIVTQDHTLATKLRALRNHGQDPEALTPDYIYPGFNCRMTEFQAALGISQMSKLDRIIAARVRLASEYDRMLIGSAIQSPFARSDAKHIYQSYVVRLPIGIADHRDEVIRRLKDHDIETTIGTWHIPMTSHYRERYGCRNGDFPIADEVFAASITLPLYELMTSSQQERVVGTLQHIVQELRGDE